MYTHLRFPGTHRRLRHPYQVHLANDATKTHAAARLAALQRGFEFFACAVGQANPFTTAVLLLPLHRARTHVRTTRNETQKHAGRKHTNKTKDEQEKSQEEEAEREKKKKQ